MPAPVLTDDEVRLSGGLRLALRRAPGAGRPFLLVHGLASNARLWDGVGERLAGRGHEVVAVDLRGHGRSDRPAGGYGTAQAAADLAGLVDRLGLTGARAPVAAGQSWGGNVVLSLAAEHRRAAGVALVDGGWIRLGARFATFEACWAELAPPRLDGLDPGRFAERIRAAHPDWPQTGVAGTVANFEAGAGGRLRARLAREHHRDILHSLWAEDPRRSYPRVAVPVLLVPAFGPDPAGDDPATADRRARVAEALAGLPRARVAYYPGADHDLHAQHPDRLAADLLDLAAEVDRG